MTYQNTQQASSELSELTTTVIYSALAGVIMFAMLSIENATDTSSKAKTPYTDINLSFSNKAQDLGSIPEKS